MHETKSFDGLFLFFSSSWAVTETVVPSTWKPGSERPGRAAWLRATGTGTVLAKECCALRALIELRFTAEFNELKDCECYSGQSWLTLLKAGERPPGRYIQLCSSFLLLFSKGSLAPRWPKYSLQDSFKA